MILTTLYALWLIQYRFYRFAKNREPMAGPRAVSSVGLVRRVKGGSRGS